MVVDWRKLQINGNSRSVEQSSKEFDLLDDETPESHSGGSTDHEYSTAPILTRGAYVALGGQETIKQYGVFGKILEMGSAESEKVPEDPRLYLNTNAPFSAVVCGLQGSGKSHTVSTMLENMLVPDCPAIGSLEQQLAGLVLYYSEGGRNARPSEAAYIGIPRAKGTKVPKVDVYVPKSSLNTLKRVYAPLGANVTVRPLLFDESELDAEAFLTMMAVESLESAPLYMQIVMAILRDLGENFSLAGFREELGERRLLKAQVACLEQRMGLLSSFLAPTRQRPRFSKGHLTIIDLSDPFIDATSACGIFEIIVRMFVRANVKTGKVLLVDEAHKFLEQGLTNGFVKSLLSLIREQRHLAMRVLISTQGSTNFSPSLSNICLIRLTSRTNRDSAGHIGFVHADGPPSVLLPTMVGTRPTPCVWQNILR
ncbi:hypothetical protein AX15_001860 [Amanita polypyramis BW_CC]|nr:hypothetical protein AX15_001860 [Amanita polypyramis BW_CC]